VISKTDLDANRKLTTIECFDPFYRPRLTQVLEDADFDPQGNFNPENETLGIKTERHYRFESDGNYEVVSNPYRTSSDGTMGRRQGFGERRGSSRGAGVGVDIIVSYHLREGTSGGESDQKRDRRRDSLNFLSISG
jgi:hypothetical protein